MNIKGTKKKNQVETVNIFEQQELLKKAEVIREKLTASTWHEAKLRGRGYVNATSIFENAKKSIGIQDGAESGKLAVKWFVHRMMESNEQLAEIETRLHQMCMEIPYAENILEISGIGENILSGILAEMGDIARFDDKISHRGRKRLRYWLFQAAKSAVAHADEFKELHAYYTIRKENPLKKKQSLVVIACKILRVIFAILTKGTTYDPKKMLGDIVRPNEQSVQVA